MVTQSPYAGDTLDPPLLTTPNKARARSLSQVLEEVLLESQDILMQNESHQSARQERLEAV
jgi:hypothetical protein